MEIQPPDIQGKLQEGRDIEDLRRLLDRAVAASSNGIVITDALRRDNPIIYVNPAFERTTGYSREEVLGRNCRFLQNDDREQEPLEELRAAIREGRECRVVLRNYRKDGTQFWNELYISPVHDDRGRLTNFIGVQNDITERKNAEEERDLLLAREQIARAEAVKARRRLALLAEVGLIISGSLDYPTRLRNIARLAVPDLADWCLVDIVEEDGKVEQLAAAHADPGREGLLAGLREHRRFDEGFGGVVAKVLRTGSSAFIEDASEDTLPDGEQARVLRELGINSCISVPLVARGKTLGAMTFVRSHEDRVYDEEDLSLAEALAYRCALAVDNSRLYRERSRIAHTLQRSLLPRLPEVPDLEIGAEYLPVGQENEVGGDFYDLIEGRSRSWVAVIGDVRGKGALAAAVMALARYTIRAVALYEENPADILSALNAAMIRQLSDYRFCTASCARLRPAGEAFELTVTRAGHPAPRVLRTDGSVEEVGRPGKALGIFPDPGFTEQTLRLLPGDTVVLYTDGVIEARSADGAFFGEGRLHGLLRSCAGLGATEVAGRIRAAVLEHSGGSPRDDIAVLTLRFPPRG